MTDNVCAKPFIKWAGGKRQLLQEIRKRYPEALRNQTGLITKYVEPFIGGGAVLYDILSNYGSEIAEIHICDANYELINCYRIIKNDPESLISLLQDIQKDYIVQNDDKRAEIYYNLRNKYNDLKIKHHNELSSQNKIDLAALFIFLNRTCFNGLYRLNKESKYNVPHGKYKNPLICDEQNLNEIHNLLKNVEIHYGDFSTIEPFCDEHTFLYADPPYRPLKDINNSKIYSAVDFDDNEQIRLYDMLNNLNKKGVYWLESNSDPQSTDPNDNFFQTLYSDYIIEKIYARRSINSDGSKRGKITELLIRNYE